MQLLLENVSRHAVACLVEAIRTVEKMEGIDEELRGIKEHLIGLATGTLPRGFRRHYSVDPHEDVEEVLARAKYVRQTLKVADQGLDDLIGVALRLKDNV